MNFRDTFVDMLNKAAISDSRSHFFDDFLTISVAVLNRDEKNYSQIVGKHTPETIAAFADMLGVLASALNDCIAQKVLVDKTLGLKFKASFTKPRYRDVLGEIFHRLELNDSADGQVFTPQGTANVIGEVTLTPEFVNEQIAKRGYVMIEERCCGSGALILGALNALLEMGINPCRFARVRASDTDQRCRKMCYLQLALYGIPAVVINQDAVTDEIWGEPLITPILKSYRQEAIA